MLANEPVVLEAIVIDSQGYKAEFVLVNTVINADGTVTEVPQYYTLKPGESFVYDGVADALSMLKPRWDGTAWTETATQQEIEAAIPPLMEPQEPAPTNAELAAQDAINKQAIAALYQMVTGGAEPDDGQAAALEAVFTTLVASGKMQPADVPSKFTA